MAEVLAQEKQGGQAAEAPSFQEEAPAPKKKKKRNKRVIVRRVVAAVILAALAGGGVFAWKKLQNTEKPTEVLTETVYRGSITSVVEGSGAVVAKNSASITLLSGGQVLDVYVSEGDSVKKGDPLYSIESSDAQARVNSEQRNVNNVRKQLDKLYEAAKDLNVRADFDGILTDVKECTVGEEVQSGLTVATLADNTRFLLPLYFSYLYENDIYVGQSATVSIPVTMAQLPGTVHEIHKVQRVSDEGGKLFEVVVAVDNPGTLTEKMAATAVLSGDEPIYPYDMGALKYFRTKTLATKVKGDCVWCNLHDYLPVRAGESVLTLNAESSDTEIAQLETQLRSAEKALEDAKKNLDSLNGVSPIDGTVLTIGINAGEEAKTGTVAVNIADTTTMVINAQIDERNISYVKPGMSVDLKLWETELPPGTVESVSLSAKSENGVARFPVTILMDNSEGQLMSGAYVNYSFVASQSSDCLIAPIQCVKSAQTRSGENCKLLLVQSDTPPENVAELATELGDVPEGFYPIIVETGISDNNNVEIKSGVEEGATVYSGVANSGIGGMGLMF